MKNVSSQISLHISTLRLDFYVWDRWDVGEEKEILRQIESEIAQCYGVVEFWPS